MSSYTKETHFYKGRIELNSPPSHEPPPTDCPPAPRRERLATLMTLPVNPFE
jgi:hypothetical protein